MKKSQRSQPVTSASPAAIPALKDFLLSMVIPCYNESNRIDLMLAGIAEFDEKWQGRYEVIIVDPGSKDGTSEKIYEALDGKYNSLKDKIKVERMPVNYGKGGALKKGVSVAAGDYILTLDTDMSARPIELINWLKRDKRLFSTDDTIYIGSRGHKEGKLEALASRKIIGGIFNSIVQLFTSLELDDTQCGFKLYPRSVALFLFENMRSKGWAHDVELLYQADLNDIHIEEMPINWVNQPESKVNVYTDSFLMFIGVLSISLRIWFYNSFILPFRIPKTANAVQRKHIVYRSVFNILSVLLVIGMPMLSFQYAINGDEHVHFDYGNRIYNYFFHGDKAAQIPDALESHLYGGIFDFTTAFVYNVFHFWDHYTTMHFMNALVGAIGIIYAGKLAKLLGHWNTGILAMGLLALSPSWFGHNFANPKDIPFSAGYTAGMYYMLLYLRALPKPTFKHIFGLIVSIGWGMGVRIGGLLLIAYLLLFAVSYGIFTRQLKVVFSVRIIRQLIIACILGYLVALICWPWTHLGIISKPFEALKLMSNYNRVNIGLLYDGNRIMSNQVPWYYIPKYILYTAPVVVLAGFVISLVVLPFAARGNRNFLLFSLMVLFACCFPLFYAIYKKSPLYDGWRHFLFIYPMIAILAAVGWTFFMDMRQRAVRFAAMALVAIGLFPPASFAITYHPLESIYFNEIAGGMKNVYGKYDTDYYMFSIKAATDWLFEHEHLGDKKVIIATNCFFPMQAYIYQHHYKNLPAKYERLYERNSDFRHDSVYEHYCKIYPDFRDNYPVYAEYVRFYERYEKDWDYCVVYSRFVEASQLTTGNWPPPETIHTINVQGVPIAAILKRKTKKDLAAFKLLKEKKPDEAKAMFYEALKDYPNNDLVWEALMKIYDAEDNPDSVLYTARMALRTYPSDIDAYQTMGTAYIKKGMIDSAINLYKSYAQYNESFSHLFLGYANAVMGNIRAAFTEIDLAIETDKNNQQAYKLGLQIAQRVKATSKEQEYYDQYLKAFSLPGASDEEDK